MDKEQTAKSWTRAFCFFFFSSFLNFSFDFVPNQFQLALFFHMFWVYTFFFVGAWNSINYIDVIECGYSDEKSKFLKMNFLEEESFFSFTSLPIHAPQTRHCFWTECIFKLYFFFRCAFPMNAHYRIKNENYNFIPHQEHFICKLINILIFVFVFIVAEWETLIL